MIRLKWLLPLLTLLLLPMIACATGAYTIEVVDSSGLPMYTSIAVDNSGHPHISYYSWDTNGLRYASRSSGGVWSTEDVDVNGTTGLYSSLAFDGTWNPHIAYTDTYYRNVLYASKSGGIWSTTTVDADPVSSGESLIFHNGEPYISYCASNCFVNYSWYDGVSWHLEPTNEGYHPYSCAVNPENGCSATSIAIDTYNNIHVTYPDDSSLLNHTWFKDSTWHEEFVSSDAYYDGTNHNIATDSAGNVYIAFDQCGYDGCILRYAYESYGGTPSFEDVDTAVDTGFYASITLNGLEPHIVYYDGNNGTLKHAWKTGGIWYTEVVDSSADVGADASSVIDSNYNLHIAYADTTNNQLKYAFISLTPPPTTTPTTPVTPTLPCTLCGVPWPANFSFNMQYNYDLYNGTYLKYWLFNFTRTGNLSMTDFGYSLMLPFISIMGYWIFLLIYLTYLGMVWIRSGDVTLPLVIGLISAGIWGVVIPTQAYIMIGAMLAICMAVIIVKTFRD